MNLSGLVCLMGRAGVKVCSQESLGWGPPQPFSPFAVAVLVAVTAAPELAALIPAASFLQLFKAAEVVLPVPAGSAGPQLALCILAERWGGMRGLSHLVARVTRDA